MECIKGVYRLETGKPSAKKKRVKDQRSCQAGNLRLRLIPSTNTLSINPNHLITASKVRIMPPQ
jgi:hypothetical protein